MASKEVVDAVRARLASWTSLPVVHPNVTDDDPVDGNAYVRVDYPVARSEQISVGAPGANVWREEGAFRLLIYSGRGEDLDQALVWAGSIATLFRGKSFGGVQTFAPSPPVTDEDSEGGNYYVIAVTVPYQFDLIG